ncbi:Variant-specific surface protein [Giardia duodenalis]|uniref:Variant-specific surface protein n=1 Tax=Giardia intestinalis TaxID=5741 RepID=V6U0K5_GIAIN|nr:Variant-specific surface protein [Giardia intestinalis]
MLNTFTLASLLAQLFLAALSSEETCTTGTGSTKCAENMCNVWIGGQKYCSQCAEAGEAPIDGICKAKGSNTCDSKVCTACTDGYFLYMGGCYKIGGTVGLLICSDTTPSDLANTAGKCTACATGYFNNPAQTAADKPPCIACNQTDPAIDNSMGVANCATCTAPKQAGAATCKTCMEGFFGDASCTQCTDTNCAKCAQAGSAQCTECKATGNEIYLKKEGASATGTCVAKADCSGANFPTVEKSTGKSICTPCSDAANGGIDGCTTCAFSQVSGKSTLTCSVCTPATKKPNKEGTGCFVCSVDGCSNCSKDGICETCSDGKKVSPGGSSCVPNCPDNSTEKETGTCLCNEGYSPKDGNCELASTGPNLSTGAIAGISVAAVVVVGGLVGFLCWWFVCRGKA